jgi:hypothetical protein
MPQLIQLWLFFAAVAALIVCRLYPHAQTEKKATDFVGSGAGRTSTRLFALEKEKGGHWMGTGAIGRAERSKCLRIDSDGP